VTSSDAAAYTDVLRILNNRWSGIEIVHAQVNVQGVQAAGSIVEALQSINRSHPDLECLILTRGGGSLEDLQAFNTEEVVRAIFASRIPVVCAVGHERDVTLSDLVADVRASTPSNAAEMVVPDKRDVLNELSAMLRHCEQRLHRIVQEHQGTVSTAIDVLGQRARHHNDAFERLDQRLRFALHAQESQLTLARTKLEHMTQLLQSMNPLHVLKRGYTITCTKDGTVVRSAKRIRAGEQLTTRFADGDIQSTAT
jgi:exodeoxyribonuclease VII large subunit